MLSSALTTKRNAPVNDPFRDFSVLVLMMLIVLLLLLELYVPALRAPAAFATSAAATAIVQFDGNFTGPFVLHQLHRIV